VATRAPRRHWNLCRWALLLLRVCAAAACVQGAADHGPWAAPHRMPAVMCLRAHVGRQMLTGTPDPRLKQRLLLPGSGSTLVRQLQACLAAEELEALQECERSPLARPPCPQARLEEVKATSDTNAKAIQAKVDELEEHKATYDTNAKTIQAKVDALEEHKATSDTNAKTIQAKVDALEGQVWPCWIAVWRGRQKSWSSALGWTTCSLCSAGCTSLADRPHLMGSIPALDAPSRPRPACLLIGLSRLYPRLLGAAPCAALAGPCRVRAIRPTQPQKPYSRWMAGCRRGRKAERTLNTLSAPCPRCAGGAACRQPGRHRGS